MPDNHPGTVHSSNGRNSRSSDDATRTSSIIIEVNGKDVKEHRSFERDEKFDPSHADPNFPDGGWRAWLVVFGAMCNTFSTFGYVNSWGTFQAYYQQNLLKDSSPSNIAWIGSIQYSLIFLPGIVVGRLFDLGYFRSLFLTSSAILVASTFLVAQCTEYWHFLLCQGITAGLACGGIFGPTTAVIAHWFKLKRGLAMGIVAVGSSLGGTIIPIAAKNLIPLVGFPWTMRIIGFILLVTLGCSNLTLKRRLPPANAPGGLLNLSAFKSAPFSIYCASAFFCFLGIYTVLTYVSISALVLGISPDLSFYLLAIANASSLFGRYASGLLCDRYGPMNVMIPFTAAAAILTYAWPFAHSKASLITVIVLYGFSSGSYVSLISNPMMELGVTDDLGRRIGMFMSIFALGALAGPPISGAINSASGGFNVVGYYAGSMVMIGVALMCLTRHLVLRRIFGKF
ncbi:Riboflavin transporter MCH5 [Hypsizygus marmoreus]|uniref:Riboflavin transporter MCH5 n=1 Tax=Hypsizygus marmoreus TaxID=39966 RepID=A0A369JNT9_HYPMA|nr:Riboflavin transporter MCH5 [Hypsizygus marmoreus]